ncbi:MAG: isoleucine--tRNA ligase [Planctomycetaceae bacterium]|jgi:isoleucyl-tRNA synthetase|nr:isoleucine--tRNA ligase [Planctomycetaceae bacterium]
MSTSPNENEIAVTHGSSRNQSLPETELEIMRFWKEHNIYAKSLHSRRDAPRFVFYEGPPTANGLPHPGHCLTRAIKDIYPRYKTMRGFLCERKAGWDTHGLPVEVEVCKELGIHSKEEIENFGIEKFIHRCRESVFRYMKEWENLTERLGFWVNLDEAYITYKKSYIESVWWSLKSLYDRGLLYQGYKIVWWWAQGGTALSAGEVGQGYRQVADPSVFVRFPLVDPLPKNDWKMFNEELAISVNSKIGFTGVIDLIIWTTTPWTLPSNQFIAVNPDVEYSVIQWTNEKGTPETRLTIIASQLVDTIASKIKMSPLVVDTIQGNELIGKRYLPPFDFYYNKLSKLKGKLKQSEGSGEIPQAWRIVAGDFVTLDTGTGIVHQAPAFGEVDFDVLKKEQERFESNAPELICAVSTNGKFNSDAIPYEGKWVKDADKEIIRDIKSKSLLLFQEQYSHEYPFCWRSEQDPLIQYPRKSWFIKTTQFKDKMLKNNKEINWLPEHIKTGRFGNFLESNVDWALSRERYWGTPLPIWVCEETGKTEVIGSYDELLKKPGVKGTEAGENIKKSHPEFGEDLLVHKPYIDAISYDSPFAAGKRMYRVPEVIDCWYDSGAMPFAQWGFPYEHGSITQFRRHFPADFISEAIDQTRGWFYSQLAISTMIFDGTTAPYGGIDAAESGKSKLKPIPYPHPFKNCIVLGLMLGEDGQKMSKQKRNYREPAEIFNKYGADALRWYFYSNQTPWTAIRYNESAIKDSLPEFIIRLQNVVSFYEVYSKIDDFEPLKLVHPDVLRDDYGQMSPFCLASAKKSAKPYRSIKARTQLDYWVLGELNQTIKSVCSAMDNFDHFTAANELNKFVDALSNWYVRRNRDRFWSSVNSDDPKKIASKNDAYWTLYECLIIVTKMTAPFVPFLAESIWQRLVDTNLGGLESVHLSDYPVADENLINKKMLREMQLIREIVSLGRAARSSGHLKVRQPLAEMKVMFANDEIAKIFWDSDVIDNVKVIQDELNIKGMRVLEDKEDFKEYVSFLILPDLKKLGQRLLGKLPEVKQILTNSDSSELMAEIDKNKKIIIKLKDQSEVTINADEIQIKLQAKENWIAAQGNDCVVVLSTELTDDLLSEGRSREIVRLIQDQRKELNLEYTDRILVGVETKSKALGESLVKFCETIKKETLAVDLKKNTLQGTNPVKTEIDGEELTISVQIAKE